MVKVFINPGHSKDCKPDPGAIGNGFKEADIAAKIGQALLMKLMSSKIDVVLYQQHEGFNSNEQLNQVPKVANASKADLFISIHLNSGVAAAKGVETLYLDGSTKGMQLAGLIQGELVKPFKNYTFTNRHIKADVRGLLVLKATSMPSCLVEVGFISNKDDVNFVNSNIDSIAERLYAGITAYLLSQKLYSTMKASVSSPTKFEIIKVGNNSNLYNLYVDSALKF